MSLRRWVVGVVALAVLLGVGAYWAGPGVVPRARLELLALDADSHFSATARLAVPDSQPRGALPRVALILALRNTGERAASPRALHLSVPGWIRLLAADGSPLPAADAGDDALRSYRLALNGEAIEPGSLPQVPAGLEQLWVVADLGNITCRLRWDGVPEFTPMPAFDPAALANVGAFYSLEVGNDRQTGVLMLHLDTALVRERGTLDMRIGPTVLHPPDVPLPHIVDMALEGRRDAVCGAPEQRVTLESMVWRTDGGKGRFIVIFREGEVRRLLYDLDGDGRIELEAWDGDRDGHLEASRTASWPIPPFLLPLPPPLADSAARRGGNVATRSDSVRRDTALSRAPHDTLPRAAHDTLPRDSSARRGGAGRVGGAARGDTIHTTRDTASPTRGAGD